MDLGPLSKEYYYIIDSRKGYPSVHYYLPSEIEDELNKMSEADLNDITIIKGVEVEVAPEISLKEVE